MSHRQTMELAQQSQMQMESLEYRLPPLFERHHSTVRYIRAGYYLDAIHSIMEGFSLNQASLEMQRDTATAKLIEVDSPRSDENINFVIDRNPMDLDTSDGQSPDEHLFVAMLYNLALSYHMLALSAIEEGGIDDGKQHCEHNIQGKEQIVGILGDSLHLYEEASIRLHNLDPKLKSSLYSIPSLHSNMRHVKLLRLQSRS
ncbi:unnamed protein product [Cylindrotheca closterium]|uniref:Uncharacterized protein n=1 Tax=Cylindrotheca closterium TaxID=2856 RepID=A0AAD2GA30_9STRA|nr:unnamed protein product [Cylindrotheca closterium]